MRKLGIPKLKGIPRDKYGAIMSMTGDITDTGEITDNMIDMINDSTVEIAIGRLTSIPQPNWQQPKADKALWDISEEPTSQEPINVALRLIYSTGEVVTKQFPVPLTARTVDCFVRQHINSKAKAFTVQDGYTGKYIGQNSFPIHTCKVLDIRIVEEGDKEIW
tara:strand:+ start:5432 stop:5920 length:489 start_codon:yes stop_codon:yes gene_type:complete